MRFRERVIQRISDGPDRPQHDVIGQLLRVVAACVLPDPASL